MATAPGTAAEWEHNNAQNLKAIADAMADKDPYMAEEFREMLAPTPEGDNVRTPRGFENSRAGREVEVVDPATGQLDNPDGPAVVKSDGTRKWYRMGLLHNAAGPAVLKPNGEVQYYYFGTRCKDAAELDDTVARAEQFAKTSKNWRNVST